LDPVCLDTAAIPAGSPIRFGSVVTPSRISFITYLYTFLLMDLKQSLNPDNIPQHVAIIMDGNGRWAQQHGRDRISGHREGVDSVREIVECCGEIGVKYLTLYAFSTENWNRPREEVDALMELLVATISLETPNLCKKGVRLAAIGDLESLPPSCRSELQESIDKTAGNDRVTLILALSYSSKWEITEAVKKIVGKVKEGNIREIEISAEIVSAHLSTARFPDPELMIRTSGEHRISNFMLWQLAYAEFYFTEILWPDFRREEFFKAILAYQNRERRFGLTSEQLAGH
jgi:undecaprenyl diphosphate synthase